MDPDLFITIAFVSEVLVVALAGGLVARSETRIAEDADATATKVEAGPRQTWGGVR